MFATQHPRWCSPFHCVPFDDLTTHRSEPKPLETSDGTVLFQWVRVDFDDQPGIVRLDLINPVQVAA